MNTRKPRRTFDDKFKLQMIQLLENGKARKDVINDYNLTPSTLDRWVKNYKNSKSFKAKDNLSEIELENIRLKKEMKIKDMELDILKQAALIMSKK